MEWTVKTRNVVLVSDIEGTGKGMGSKEKQCTNSII